MELSRIQRHMLHCLPKERRSRRRPPQGWRKWHVTGKDYYDDDDDDAKLVSFFFI